MQQIGKPAARCSHALPFLAAAVVCFDASCRRSDDAPPGSVVAAPSIQDPSELRRSVAELRTAGRSGEIDGYLSQRVQEYLARLDLPDAGKALQSLLRAHDDIVQKRRAFWDAWSQSNSTGTAACSLQRAVGDLVIAWRIEANCTLNEGQRAALSGLSTCLRLAAQEERSEALRELGSRLPDWAQYTNWQSEMVSSHDIATSAREQAGQEAALAWETARPRPNCTPAPGVDSPGTEIEGWVVSCNELRRILGVDPAPWDQELRAVGKSVLGAEVAGDVERDRASVVKAALAALAASELQDAVLPIGAAISAKECATLGSGRYSWLPDEVLAVLCDPRLGSLSISRGREYALFLGRRK